MAPVSVAMAPSWQSIDRSPTPTLTMDRIVEPELLDALAANEKKALSSRADLRRINFLMGNATTLMQLLHNGTAGRRVSCLVE